MIPRSHPHILVLLIFLFVLPGCGKQQRKSIPKDALVCVNNRCLTERDIQYQIPEEYLDSVTLEEKKEYLRRWIRNEILYQQAKKEKLDQDQKVKSLVKQGIKDIVVGEFIQRKLKDRIKITEEEALRYYRQNRERFIWDDDYVRIAHIFVKGMAKVNLADLLLKEGNPFEDVALRMSQDEKTKEKGGDLGFVKLQDLPPEVMEFALVLKPGEISPPIRTSYGYEIVKVIDRRKRGTPKEFEWAKEEIKNILYLQARKKEIDRLLKQLGEKMEIVTFDWASEIALDEFK